MFQDNNTLNVLSGTLVVFLIIGIFLQSNTCSEVDCFEEKDRLQQLIETYKDQLEENYVMKLRLENQIQTQKYLLIDYDKKLTEANFLIENRTQQLISLATRAESKHNQQR